MCHKVTVSMRRYLLVAALALTSGILSAQNDAGRLAPGGQFRDGNGAWRRPLPAPCRPRWYSPDGSRLYARTRTGRVFETTDFENWNLPQAPAEPPKLRRPRWIAFPSRARSWRRLLSHLAGFLPSARNSTARMMADDRGLNLTAFHNQSIIGSAQRSVAVSPADPGPSGGRQRFRGLAVDGRRLILVGIESALAEFACQPNFGDSRRHARHADPGQGSRRHGIAAGRRSLAADYRSAGRSRRWRITAAVAIRLGTEITAIGDVGLRQFTRARRMAAFGYRSIPAKPGLHRRGRKPTGPLNDSSPIQAKPRVALAAVGGWGAHVLRTTNSGGFWDDLTSNLPDVPAHGVTAVRAAGAVYVATDKGVFYAIRGLGKCQPRRSELDTHFKRPSGGSGH